MNGNTIKNLIENLLPEEIKEKEMYIYPSKLLWDMYKQNKNYFYSIGARAGKDDENEWCFIINTDRFPFSDTQMSIKDKIEKLDVNLDATITEKLFQFQIEHTKDIVSTLIQMKAVLDSSHTGTGKTYTTCASIKYLKLIPVIIAPKNILSSWQKVLKYFDIKDYFISNIEQYKTGKFGYFEKVKTEFKCNLNQTNILIVDEAHCIKNRKSQNTQMVKSALNKCMIMYLSATMVESPLDLSIVGRSLQLFEEGKFFQFAVENGAYKDRFGWNYCGNYNKKLHNMIFNARKSFSMKKSLTEGFKKCSIITEPLDINKKAMQEIQELYIEIFELAKNKDMQILNTQEYLAQRIYLRQKIELIKVPLFIDIIKNQIQENCSVCVFVNFIATVEQIVKGLSISRINNGIITGDQNQEDRNEAIQQFNEDKIRCIISTIQSGGAGISLHDVTGKYQRYSIISPTDNARDFKQTLGRIDRAGAKTNSTQRIILINGTIEEEVADNLSKKIKNIDQINDGDVNNKTIEDMKSYSCHQRKYAMQANETYEMEANETYEM